MKQVKKVTAISTLILLSICVQAFAADVQIQDMPTGWSKKAVEEVVVKGWLTADQGKVYPKRALTRAELSAVVNRIFNAKELKEIGQYSDVPSGSWYEKDMAKAVNMKSLVGEGDKLYPERKITRQEAFAVICRVLEMSEGNISVLDKYADGASVAPWARGSMAAMIEYGYVSGSEDGLRPTAEISREEFAQLMNGIADTVVTQAGEYSQDYAGNLLINQAGVNLKDAVVHGDLILCDGVGNGDVQLDNVTVEGRLVIRGGGKNTIKLISSLVKGEVVVNNVNHPIRLLLDEKTVLKEVSVKNQVFLEGSIENLTIAEKAEVTLVSGEIQQAEILSSAENSKVIVNDGADIKRVTVNAKNTKLSGDGKIEAVLARASGVSVSTLGTKVTAEKGTDILAGDAAVEEGKTVVVKIDEKAAEKETADKKKNSGGGSGNNGGGSTNPNPGTNPGTDPGTNPGTDPGTNPGTDPGETPTAEQWIDQAKTGIIEVDFAKYAVVALKLNYMNSENPSEYAYYINGIKVDAGDISVVMKSKDNTNLVVKILLQNNSDTQTIRLVKASEYKEVSLTNLQ